MSVFELWLLFTLPQIGELIVVLSLSGLILSLFVGAVLFAVGRDDNDLGVTAAGKKLMTRVAPMLVAAIVVGTLIPSPENMKYIVGGYVATNADSIENLPDNLAKAANKFLEDYSDDKKDE